MTTYSAKSAAVRAAKSALGPTAKLGVDFAVHDRTVDLGGWVWNGTGTMEVIEKPAKASTPPDDFDMGAPTPAPAPEAKKERTSGKKKAAEERAERGELPVEPDFSAETHKRWRPKLAEVVAMATAGDLKGLRRYEIKAVSTSPKAIERYRKLAIMALEARKGVGSAA